MRLATIASIAFALPFASRAVPIRRQLDPNDVLVLKFAQVLEQLETEFYKQALSKFQDQDFVDAGFAVPDVPKQLFASILEHEDAHTSFLTETLQRAKEAPLDTCQFNFDSVLVDVKTMATVARVVEQVGVGAYLGGASLVVDKSILVAAASILTIEARHQSALNILNGGVAIPQAFDVALSPQQVLALASPFITGCDLGIAPNAPVKITNTPAPGTKVEFDLTGLEGDLSCQMLVAGHAITISQPIDHCIVPTDLPDGPVFLFITNDAQPIVANVIIQNVEVIKAGPAILFIDQQPDALSDLLRLGEAAQEVVNGGHAPPSNIDTSNGSNGDMKVLGTTKIPA